MEKRHRRGLLVLSGLSPDSVDELSVVMSEPPPLAAAPATERSERVGEEAEGRLIWYVLLTPYTVLMVE